MAELTQLELQMELLNKNLMNISSALQDLTATINKLQIAGKVPETRLTSGYTNWSSKHDLLKTDKWIKMSTFLGYCMTMPVTLRCFNDIDIYTVDEDRRFPQDDIYLNLNNPLVKFNILYMSYNDCKDRIFDIAKSEAYTFNSFEKEHGLKWVEPPSEASDTAEDIQGPKPISKSVKQTLEPVTQESWVSEELASSESKTTNTNKNQEQDLLTRNQLKDLEHQFDRITDDNLYYRLKKIKQILSGLDNEKQLQLVAKMLHDRVLERPDSVKVFAQLAFHLSYIKKISDADPDKHISFRGHIIGICQNKFEEFIQMGNKHDHVDHIHDLNMSIGMQAVTHVKFIGELYKLDVLTTRIIQYCLQTLSDIIEDDKLECFCELLATVGKKLGHDADKYIKELYRIKNSQDNKVSEHVLDIIQSVIDFKERNWTVGSPILVKKFPKTITEIQRDTREIVLLNQSMNSLNLRDNTQKKPRSLADVRLYPVETLKGKAYSKNTQNYIQDPPKFFSSLNVETLDKLQADLTSRDNILFESDVTFKPCATIKSQSNQLKSDKVKKGNIKKEIRLLIDEHLVNQDIDNLKFEFAQYTPNDHSAAVKEFLDLLLERSEREIRMFAESLFHLCTGMIAPHDFLAGLKATLEKLPDSLIVIPHLYLHLGTIVAPIIASGFITFEQMFEVSETIIAEDHGMYLLFSLLETMYEREGLDFTKRLWLNSKMRASQWMNEDLAFEWPVTVLNVIGDETI